MIKNTSFKNKIFIHSHSQSCKKVFVIGDPSKKDRPYRIAGLYQITNVRTQKKYIGRDYHLGDEIRLKKHQQSSHNTALRRDIDQEMMACSNILELHDFECTPSSSSTISKLLISHEEDEIRKIGKNMYNISSRSNGKNIVYNEVQCDLIRFLMDRKIVFSFQTALSRTNCFIRTMNAIFGTMTNAQGILSVLELGLIDILSYKGLTPYICCCLHNFASTRITKDILEAEVISLSLKEKETRHKKKSSKRFRLCINDWRIKQLLRRLPMGVARSLGNVNFFKRLKNREDVAQQVVQAVLDELDDEDIGKTVLTRILFSEFMRNVRRFYTKSLLYYGHSFEYIGKKLNTTISHLALLNTRSL